MDATQINKLLGELKKDEKFRTEFLKDPVGSLKSHKYSLTPDQEEKLKSMDTSDLKKKIETGMMANDCTYKLCG